MTTATTQPLAASAPSAQTSSTDTAQGNSADGQPHYELELSVVMPCLNEARTVAICVKKAVETMQRLGISGEVVISDNGSTDGSQQLATDAGARVVHCPDRGYGNALRYGFQQSRGRFILMGDSDDSYDFTDIGRFVDRLRAGAEMVVGNRFAGEIKPGAMPWHHYWIGNPVLTFLLNLMFRTGIGDTHCGMRAFRRDALPRMNLKMPGMELASEMVIKSRQAKLNVVEIPITLHPDGRGRPPHLRSWRDGWRHLRFMLMCCPSFLFVLPGMLLTMCGVAAIPAAELAGYGVYDRVFGPTFLFTVAMLSVVGLNLTFFGVLAKLYTQQMDSAFAESRLNWWMTAFTVERGLWLGGGLLIAGMALAVPTLVELFRSRSVPHPANWILAVTLGTLGIETLFGSFLVGIVQLPVEGQTRS